jgi:hypothetical protein
MQEEVNPDIQKCSLPSSGYGIQYSWMIAREGGAISSFYKLNGSSSSTINGAKGMAIRSTISCVSGQDIDIMALGLPVAFVTASGGVQQASLAGAVFLYCTASGQSGSDIDISANVGISATVSGQSGNNISIAGGIGMIGTISGTSSVDASGMLVAPMGAVIDGEGNVTNAPLIGAFKCMAVINGQGTFTADASAIGHLLADINAGAGIDADIMAKAFLGADVYVNVSQATVKATVDALWGADATRYNESGTMGNKVNAAGTAGDPWTADLSGYIEGTAGKKLNDIEPSEDPWAKTDLAGYPEGTAGKKLDAIPSGSGTDPWVQENLDSYPENSAGKKLYDATTQIDLLIYK